MGMWRAEEEVGWALLVPTWRLDLGSWEGMWRMVGEETGIEWDVKVWLRD